jgi:hypothetical protein
MIGRSAGNSACIGRPQILGTPEFASRVLPGAQENDKVLDGYGDLIEVV